MEKIASQPDFWHYKDKALKISQRIAELKQELKNFNIIFQELKDLKEFQRLASQDGKIAEQTSKNYLTLKEKILKIEQKVFLSGPYDKRTALLEIFAGAGGQDAQDWARILLRMYQKYCQKKGWQAKIIFQAFGQGVWEGEIGLKEATLEIKGSFAYGLLKREKGVHRLVRISPFSSQKLRHTSFARVEVLPEIITSQDLGLKILPKDLKIETFRASGPGGQHVNRRESAVRITHLPTGITASSQAERQQGLNRKTAIKVLSSKLFELRQKKLEKEKAKMKGMEISASWGHQTRSYILHPYKLVKDLRTGLETSEVGAVLDGELDQFIQGEPKMKS